MTCGSIVVYNVLLLELNSPADPSLLPLLLPRKKGCSSACLAVGRLSGSRSSRALTKSLASSLTPLKQGLFR